MAKWKIDGADRRDGQDRTLTIEAPDRGSAEAQAVRDGLLVSAVEPVGAVPPIDYASSSNPRTERVRRRWQNTIPEMILILALVVSGIILLAAAISGSWQPRFQSDNAIGATANAIEEQSRTLRAVAGFAALMLATVIRIYGTVRTLSFPTPGSRA